ncbi:hypothetical protein F5Y17DRAFT_333984 [Xylariaceae sp. FL0594]|nr:hypothetical protein F5Y17DRAFT_333984 [Xylariaceae sp. FL0594]
MSLARAFTTRRVKQSSTDAGALPHRSNTITRGFGQSGSIRNKISSPMELTHTTNMLAYNAPDLYPQSSPSPPRTSRSDDETSLDSPSTAMSSPPTSPDISSPALTLESSESPEPNHLSCYFSPTPLKPTPSSGSVQDQPPRIPKRAPSHTKKASFENMANKQTRLSNQSNQTVSTGSSIGLSRSSSTSTSGTSVASDALSQKFVSSNPVTLPVTVAPSPPAPRFRRPTHGSESQHPFGHELAKVTELAEELGVKDKLQGIDDEEEQLLSKGLYKFSAEDYLTEIHGLLSTFMIPEPAQLQPVWI